MKKKSLSAKKTILKLSNEQLKNPKILKIFNQFKNSLKIKKNFAIAVSGGADSLALAFLASCYAANKKLNLKAYIVDHKLRKESSLEAKNVKDQLKKIKVKSKILVWKGKKPSQNIQAIARENRYNLLLKQCQKDSLKFLLLGHHVDDLYENFLIRMLRGSGLKGLTSFGTTSEYKKNDISIIRPMMGIKKKDLIFLAKKVFKYFINDPSNVNKNFKRIRIRFLIDELEKEGLDKEKLKLTINNLKDSSSTIDFYVNKNINNNSKYIKSNNTFILSQFFFEQPHEIVFRSLSYLIRSISKKYYMPRGKNIENLIDIVKSDKIDKGVTLGGCFIKRINKTTIISRENII